MMTIQLTPATSETFVYPARTRYDQPIANVADELLDFEYVGKLYTELLSLCLPKMLSSNIVSYGKMERFAKDIATEYLAQEYANNINIQSFAYGFDLRRNILPSPQHAGDVDIYRASVLEKAEELERYKYDPTLALDLLIICNANMGYREFNERLNRMLKNVYNPKINMVTYILSACALYTAKYSAELWACSGKHGQNSGSLPGHILAGGIAGAIAGSANAILEDIKANRELRWADAGAWAMGSAMSTSAR
jgi:hypothetical protein